MAAPHVPPVNEVIRAAYETRPRDRGGLAAMAREADVSRNAVSTWVSGRVTPDKEFWPLIERHLDIAPGRLARVAAIYFDPTVAELEADVLTNEQFGLAAEGTADRLLPKNRGGERRVNRPTGVLPET